MNVMILRTWLRARFASKEDGASMVEYAFLVALVAMVAIVAVKFLGGEVSTKFDTVGESFRNS